MINNIILNYNLIINLIYKVFIDLHWDQRFFLQIFEMCKCNYGTLLGEEDSGKLVHLIPKMALLPHGCKLCQIN